MNSDQQIPIPADELDEIETNDLGSVDDFLRELEAKEKDLHITSDLSIEIEDSEVETAAVQEYFAAEVARPPAVVPSLTDSSGAPINDSPAGDERISRLTARVKELELENAELNQTVKDIRAERNEIKEASERRVKDFENFKHRMDRERRGSFIEQLANLASQMLPVLDNLDRALNSVPPTKDGEGAERNEFYDGIFLVNQQLLDVLVSMGIETITTKDQPFDPAFHEAVATDERDDIPHNTIVDELLRGYRIGNRVVRHSMVKVAVSNAAKAKTVTESTPEEIESAKGLTDELESFAEQAFDVDITAAPNADDVADFAIAQNDAAASEHDGGLADMLERFDSDTSHKTPDSN